MAEHEQPEQEPSPETEPERPRPAGRQRRSQQRHEARTLALETLYETDVARHHPAEVLRRRLETLRPPPEVESYARELLNGVLAHRRELDDIIQARAPAWPVAQMAAIDRNILRLGLYESLYQRDTVPVKVAISEAVELAKQFGSESSARFVNGVLGRVVGSTAEEPQDSGASPDHTTEEES